MRFFNGLILGLILGIAGYWYMQKQAREHPAAEQRYQTAASQVQTSATDTAQHLSDAFQAKIDTLDLRTDQITNELARTGRIVRHKATEFGNAVADAAADARIVTEIKAKYAVDNDLSVWKISVSSDQGHVTLSGSVSAPADIGKAVALALDVSGVRDVTSTIQVRPPVASR